MEFTHRKAAPFVQPHLPRMHLLPTHLLRTLVLLAWWLCSAAAAPAMATTVSAGHSHTCGINRADVALCWGSNAAGELGDGSRTDRDGPVAVQGLPAVAVSAIQAGRGFSCALLGDQSVHCWGRITGSTNTTAQSVQGLPPVLQLAAGSSHACALTVAGDVYCWGDGSRGQRGVAATAAGPVLLLPGPHATVVAALSSPAVSRLVAGGDATCALAGATGQVACVGTADWLVSAAADPGQPRAVPGLGDALDMAAHEGHACVLRRAGGVACWGRNESGQLDGRPASPSFVTTVPVDATGLLLPPPEPGAVAAALSISVGAGVSCAVQSTRRVRCWGAQALLGAGNDKNPWWQGQAVGIDDAVLVSAGGTHACAMLEGGYVQCWGSNANGQLGGAGLCNVHLALYFNYRDNSPRFNIGPCVPYTAGITPHEVKGFDVRRDADRVLDWAEVSLTGALQWGLDSSFNIQEGYYQRLYPGGRSLAVSTNGTPHVFYVGPETGGAWTSLGRLTHWVRQVK